MHAKNEGINYESIIAVRASLLTSFCDLNKCHGNNKKSKIVSDYFNKNPDILIVPID